MTVADNTSRNQYTATSGQTVFAYTFEIVDKDHIVVLQNGTALSEGTDYTVSNVGNDNGGNVTLTSGATAGDVMTLYREMPYSRTQNYTNSGDFLASEVNADFDELWLAGEQTDRSFSQSIRKPITDSDSISMELPEAATRANKFVKFDATGAVDVAGATVTVSAEDVSIDDAGNYYTSDNVEGALQEVGASLDTKLENVVEDTTPQLGGDLDVNGNDITGTGNIDLTGNLDVSGTATVGAVTYTGTDGTDGQVLMTDGAGNASFEDMPSSTYLDVKDFGATGDGTTDDTTAIQNAINHASNNEIQTIFFPDGHYKYTTLRFYHDATDNPNFQETPNRDGRFQLRGTGRLAITDLKNVGKSPNRIYGSILESTSTGDGLIVEPTGTFQTTTDARNFVVKDLTLVADNTGYIVTAESCPGITFDHCSFKQLNHQGSGILARNCWFFTMNQCYVFGQSWIDEAFATAGQTEFSYTFDNPASTSDIIVQKKGGLVSSSDYSINTTTKVVTLNTGADLNDKVTISRKNTGDGISSQFVGSAFGSFAGLWNITDSLVDSWANGVHWTGGQVTNLSLRNTGVQNCNNYNIYGDAGVIQQMLLDNVYMENQSVQGVSFIKGDGSGTSSATIRNLRMINCFMLAGGTFPRVTGTCIDIDSIEVIDIEGMYVFRMRQPFLNITATKNLQNVPGEIKNSLFATDQDLSAEPTIYLLSGKIPNVHNCVWPGFSDGFYDTTNDILLFDPSVESNFPRQYTDIKGTTGTAKFGFGDTKVVTGITSGPYNITGSNSRTYYDLTHSIAGGLKVILPDTGEVNDGRLIIIKNNEASTSTSQFPYINVVNNSDQNTTIGRLSPGQAGLFVLDQQNSTEFKYVGRTFTDDLELTDDHKITFGRGTSAGPDMEIYHDSTSGESRIDTLAGLTLDGLTYPTADGTSGQSIITDGSGNLTFGTAAGTGITAVVEDTTPQLGGDLESNGHDILFADNDKAIFGAGSDLQIYHTGSSSIIRDSGTGNLSIQAEDFAVQSADASATHIFVDASSGYTALNYGGSTKLNTTNTGIDVTGDVVSDGLTVNTIAVSTSQDNGVLFGANAQYGMQLKQYSTAGGVPHASVVGPDDNSGWLSIEVGGSQNEAARFSANGDISFYDGAGTSQDLFWDASTSRLGLGTTSPQSVLHINDPAPTITLSEGAGSTTLSGDGANLTYTVPATKEHRFKVDTSQVMTLDSDGIDVTGSINTVLSVDGTTEDVFITGAVPALEFVENDSGGSRMRMAWNTSGSFSPTLYQSLYGDSTTTYGGINIQTRASDGSGNQVVYAYDPINDRNWWGTRASGDVLMQLQSDGTFNVRGGDVSFENAAATSDDFYWDASTSRLGLGITNPSYDLSVVGSSAAIQVDNTAGSPDQMLMLFQADMGTNDRNFQIKSPTTDSNAAPFRFVTSNSFAFEIDEVLTLSLADNKYVGIGDEDPIDRLTVSRLGATWTGVTPNANTTALFHPGTTNATSGSAITIAANASSASSIYFSSATDNDIGLLSYSHTDDSMQFRTNNSERMRIDSSGNVGIGTTSPSDTLHVKTPSTAGGLLVESNNFATIKGFSSLGPDYKFTIAARYADESFSILGGNDYKLITSTGYDTPNTLIFHTSNTERMRLDSSGNVGIGTDSPVTTLHLSNSDPRITLTDTDAGGNFQIRNIAGGAYISTLGAHPMLFSTDSAEAMRIDSSGNLFVGCSSTPSATEHGFGVNPAGVVRTSRDGTGAASHYIFYNDNGDVGSIDTNGTSTSYTTSSDQRLKENIVDAPSASDDIDAIQVRSFDWKADGSHQKYGMVAQELQSVAPEAVSGDADSDEMMGVDYSKLVPMLVKEIQSLRARVAQLEGAN